VKLTEQDLRMLNGEEGPGRRKCMDFLVKMGEAFDAEEMGNALSAQIHAAIPTSSQRRKDIFQQSIFLSLRMKSL